VLERDTIGSPRASQLKSRRTHEGAYSRTSGQPFLYYTPLLAMFDHAVAERFLKPENRALVLAGESPADLLQAPEEWRPVRVEKWLSRETR
jgi:hypothetical protein